MTVNKERIELWCRALESDKYQQCTGMLRLVRGHLGQINYCAAGIGILVAELEDGEIWRLNREHACGDESVWTQYTELPPHVAEWYGLMSNPLLGEDSSVLNANDIDKLSFWDIAQLIRAEYLKDEG